HLPRWTQSTLPISGWQRILSFNLSLTPSRSFVPLTFPGCSHISAGIEPRLHVHLESILGRSFATWRRQKITNRSPHKTPHVGARDAEQTAHHALADRRIRRDTSAWSFTQMTAPAGWW